MIVDLHAHYPMHAMCSREGATGAASRLEAVSDAARVRPRPLTARHAGALLELRRRNERFFAPFMPLRPPGYLTLAVQTAEIAAHEAQRERDEGHVFGIFEAADDELIGRLSLTQVVRAPFCNASLGYFLDERRGGRGLAIEAVGQALELAFDQLGLHRVQAAVMPANLRSIRVLERNGFRREGLAPHYLQIDGAWEDHILFALTVEDRPSR